MLLTHAKEQQELQIIAIKDNTLKTHLLKLGLGEGDVVRILGKIVCGPMLLECKSQEIALGMENIACIEVNAIHEELS
ncbi:ferrous iron transport protein A [Candidatus Woesearchaeota archaeon]|nr:ferrous iron transport protein A [Candidatus Woesearchaeota archaeon]